MNLQPINPPLASNGEALTVFCSPCGARTRTDEGFADLDAKPGTYVCRKCRWPEVGSKPYNPEFLGAQPPRAGEDY